MDRRRHQQMRALAALAWIGLVLGAADSAGAQPAVELQDELGQPDESQTDTRAASDYFCDWVEAEADAEAVVLLAPEAYMTGGLTRTSGSGPSDDDLSDDGGSRIRPRLLSGLRYRFANLRRRNLTYERARAQCHRYRAFSSLTSILAWGSDLGRRESLEAQRASLLEALDEARAMAAEVEQRVEVREGTVLELYTTSERIDDFSDALSRIELSLRQLDLRPEMSSAAPPELLASYLAGDREVLEAEYALERARTWELELRGEYDWVIGETSSSDDLPLSVTVRATFNFGRLWQGSAHRRAHRAREGFLMQEEAELRTRMTRLVISLSDQLAEEQRRLAELTELAAAIDEQLEMAAASDSQLAQELYTRLWFDAAEIRAERIGLRARVEALEAFVAGD